MPWVDDGKFIGFVVGGNGHDLLVAALYNQLLLTTVHISQCNYLRRLKVLHHW